MTPGYTAKPGVVVHTTFGLEMGRADAMKCRAYHAARLALPALPDIDGKIRDYNMRRLAELDAAIAVAWPDGDAP